MSFLLEMVKKIWLTVSSYLSSKIEFLPKKLSRGFSNPDFFGFTDCFLKAEVDLNNIKVPGKWKSNWLIFNITKLISIFCCENGKVIHTKCSKHRPSTVAHTFECMCSKINHGLNHGLFILLLKLINCPIHWIVCVLAYFNFIFEF